MNCMDPSALDTVLRDNAYSNIKTKQQQPQKVHKVTANYEGTQRAWDLSFHGLKRV